VGVDCCIGPEPVKSMPYANTLDCLAHGSSAGLGNIDLTGLPFIVDDTFVIRGFNPGGSVNGVAASVDGAAFPVRASIVNLTGGGYCGGIGPTVGGGRFNQYGAFDLQLKYVGNAALDEDRCAKGGWRDFGIFRSKRECERFFEEHNGPEGGHGPHHHNNHRGGRRGD
jgi:hypothetical protein